MLNKHSNENSIPEKMASFEKACKDAGLKLTHQRLEIYKALTAAKDHPSAEMLYKRLQQLIPTISLDTIYRTLSSFEKHKLISRVDTTQSQARFEAENRQHHHLICTSCKEIIDFQWESFDGAELPQEIQNWGNLTNRNISLHGICNKCLGNNT